MTTVLEVKERPIMFTENRPQQIFDGKKTMTRREVKPQPTAYPDDLQFRDTRSFAYDTWNWAKVHQPAAYATRDVLLREMLERCPFGKPGDRLWVKETWGTPDADSPQCDGGRRPQQGDKLVYRADEADAAQWDFGVPSRGGFAWRSPMYMPRWASRILLDVVSVKVERVQDISYEDAIKEGSWGSRPGYEHLNNLPAYRTVFRDLWDSVNGEDAWERNDWCWCIEFKLVNQNAA